MKAGNGIRPIKERPLVRLLLKHLASYRLYLLGLLLVLCWCMPYITSGDRLEWGDFSFFAQNYEAIRISILNYHQFPWWNPWVSGGVPLYANPQIGVFSIQLPLALIFGASVGLKYALICYTILGYSSMYLLTRGYFKIDKLISTLLSLIWIFCSFFVAHLPAHFTFAWYMATPLFIFLSLKLRSYKSGALLGGSLAIMALSQTHNPFVHISLISGVIVLIRLLTAKQSTQRIGIARGISTTVGTLILFAGHRIILTYQNIHDFPRDVADLAPSLTAAMKGFFLPLSLARPLNFIQYPDMPPAAPQRFTELAATIGVFALAAVLIATLICLHTLRTPGAISRLKGSFVVLGIAAITFLFALGSFAPFTPYSLLKNLPVLADMRVSTRWFIFTDLSLLLFVGFVAKKLRHKSFEYFCLSSLLVLSVIELFTLNVGYQSKVLLYEPVHKSFNTSTPFTQQSYFGSTHISVTGKPILGATIPVEYEEYNSTLYNIGVLYANDALVQIPLANKDSPRCGIDKGCRMVLSHNANITYWSPNKIMLRRTSPGDIVINMNQSNYMLINGERPLDIKVSEPFKSFVIKDEGQVISIVLRPSLAEALKSFTEPKPTSDY